MATRSGRTFGPIGSRRKFLSATGGAFAGLVASGCTANGVLPSSQQGRSSTDTPTADPYGDLVSDPASMLDLPQGFSYRVISSLGDPMDDGGTVPDRADGMGCFDLGDGKLVLVRNHELLPEHDAGGTLADGYQRDSDGSVLPGGTTHLVLDADTLALKRQFRSLAGTVRNCAGGTTPWGTWLTCEEPGGSRMDSMPENGFVFEVPAGAAGQIEARPIKAIGRFNHEAACVDPATGIVYLSEDTDDSMLYRFVPKVPGQLDKGGRLQALALTSELTDSRNWNGTANMALGMQYAVRWIDLENPESPANDLRYQAAAQGGLLIARGEGIHMGDGEIYLCATNGGSAECGQIFRLTPGVAGTPDRFELFFESTDSSQFNFGDNLTVQDNGHLIVCEDGYDGEVNHLRGITPDGAVYPLGRLNMETELAGACFSPDGKTLFLNVYSPTRTIAITGPWVQ